MRFIISAALTLTLAATTATSQASAQINSPDPEGYCTRAILMFDDGNYVGCIDQMNFLRHHEAATEEQLEDAAYYSALSAAHLGQPGAQAQLRHYIWRYPTSPRVPLARLAIANLQVDAGRFIEALQSFDTIDPEGLDSSSLAEWQYGRAFCLLRQGRNDEADPLFRAAARDERFSNGARFYQGYIAYAAGDYQEAARIFRSVNAAKAPATAAPYYLCQIAYTGGNYQEAANSARKLLSSPAEGIEPAYRLEALRIAGESLYNLGNDAQAIDYLSKYAAEAVRPEPSALYILGIADYRSGNYSDAISALTPVATLDNAMGQSANLYIGQAFMQQGAYSSAMMAFEKAFSTDFDSDVKETAFYNYAVAKTEGGSVPFGSSVTNFEQFLTLYPSSRYVPEVSRYLVEGYITDDNYPAALASINKVAKPTPEILAAKQQVLYTLGARRVAAGSPTEGIDYLNEALSLSSYNPATAAEIKLWLGEGYYANDMYAKAAKAFADYVSDPNANASRVAPARYSRAYSLFKNGDYDEARNEFLAFTTNATGSEVTPAMVADAWNRIGDTYYVGSNFAPAYKAYASAEEISPATADYPILQQALISGYQRNYGAKVASLENLVSSFPQSALVPRALLELGEAYNLLGNSDKSIATYASLVERYPASSYGRRASLLLASAHLNRGDIASAEQTYRDLITAAPTSEEGQQALADLKDLLSSQGRYEDFNLVAADVPGAPTIDDSELEQLTFANAERSYLQTGATAQLNEYLAKFPDGNSRADALQYAAAAAYEEGNLEDVIKYSAEIVERYHNGESYLYALENLADAQYATGRIPAAHQSYTRLANDATDPTTINVARLGIMHSAFEIGEFEEVIENANAITSSAIATADQRAEASFTRAMAYSQLEDAAAAAAEWEGLADNTDDIYGAKSAYYLANQLFEQGKIDEAEKAALKLISAKTPHDYWLARTFILMSDIKRAQGNDYEAEYYLAALRKNYPGTEADIFAMIDERLAAAANE